MIGVKMTFKEKTQIKRFLENLYNDKINEENERSHEDLMDDVKLFMEIFDHHFQIFLFWTALGICEIEAEKLETEYFYSRRINDFETNLF